MEHWEIFFFFLLIAFTYASVGFGGGSSYLAILAIYALPFKEIRLIALLCEYNCCDRWNYHFYSQKANRLEKNNSGGHVKRTTCLFGRKNKNKPGHFFSFFLAAAFWLPACYYGSKQNQQTLKI